MKTTRRTMHPAIWLAALAVLATTTAPRVLAQESAPQPMTKSATENGVGKLPLRDVVLFSSGVGYFGRRGQISGGDDAVEMRFRAENVNDILKSLVVLDPRGQARPVTYGIEGFVANRPHPADLVLDSAATLGAILRRFQGAQVRVQTSKETVEGRIVSVGVRRIGNDPASTREVETLTIFSESGLRVVTLEDVSSVQLLDANLNRRLRDSLEKLASNVAAPALDDGTRAVTIRFSGKEAREVRVGYLQETPVWKTSYRLILDDKEKPFLQGWAIVENTGDEDWTNVNLSLVAGRPISFTQNLYQPLYVSRPEVAPQVLGVPRSQSYEEAVDGTVSGRVTNLEARPAPTTRNRLANAPAAAMPGGMGGGAFSGMMKAADAASESEVDDRRRDIGMSAGALAQQAAAQGEARGDLFEYSLQTPVTIPRAQAALVPILNGAIGGAKLSIVDTDAADFRPVRGFLLKNDTKLHLAGGPITVFDDGIYGGDAQITNVAPGESRLISYALDLDLAVSRDDAKLTQTLTSISARAGVLVITRALRREQDYTLKNKGDKAKTVIVQKRREDSWQLTQPTKADETTASEYRFRVPVGAGKTEKFSLALTHPESEEVALLDADFDLLVNYARHAQVSPKLKTALQDLVARRRKIVALAQRRAQNEAEIKAITAEQERIRRNMATVGKGSPLYATYLKKLTEQEARIETLQTENARLQSDENAARAEMAQFVDTISAE